MRADIDIDGVSNSIDHERNTHVHVPPPSNNHLDTSFGNTTDDYLKVHYRGSHEADVTEGSRGIWERLHYDWSDPNRIVLTTTDSNLWGGGSGHTYTFMRRPDGKTDVDAIVVREGKNIRGRLLGFVLGIFGRSVLERAFESSVKAIEARNGKTPGDAAKDAASRLEGARR